MQHSIPDHEEIHTLTNTMITSHPLSSRRGATVTEFALTLPILLLLVFAGIEFSRAGALMNSAKIAAAEGARRGIILGTTSKDIQDVVKRELSMIGVDEATVLVNPAQVTDNTDIVTVGIKIPLNVRNGYVTPRFFVGDYVWRITAIPREAKNDAAMDSLLATSFDEMVDELDVEEKESKGKGKGKDKKKKKGDDDDD
jgi:Flp pilus assembly protein TadG